MSHCVVSLVLDGDRPAPVMRPRCVVHASWAPCDLNGETASTVALHGDPIPSRDEAIAGWAKRTHRQRPYVLHNGSLLDEREHVFDDAGSCWCKPVIYEADL